jgi:hypothetical protein
MSGNGRRLSLGGSILAWGLVWGTAEASVGHILHWIPIPGLAGLVMIPAAIWILARAFAETGRPGAIAAASIVAASVKLADLALPGRGPSMALRPALAILCEGLLIAALYAAVPRLLRRTA